MKAALLPNDLWPPTPHGMGWSNNIEYAGSPPPFLASWRLAVQRGKIALPSRTFAPLFKFVDRKQDRALLPPLFFFS